MSTLNAFQVLAKKKLIGLAADLVMKDDPEFAKDLAKLLLKHGVSRTELVEIIKEIKDNDVHNKIEQKVQTYVYDRFSLFDENLNGLRRNQLCLAH